jgi:hypothetical protein
VRFVVALDEEQLAAPLGDYANGNLRVIEVDKSAVGTGETPAAERGATS